MRRGTLLGLILLGTVTCDPPFPSPHMGRLIITTITAGVDPDPDGYEVILDDQSLGMLAPNGRITLDTILSGRHRVTIDSVAGNCGVAAPRVRDVQVPRDDSVVVAFGVFCRVRLGAVRVMVTTTGPDPDINGYTVAFDSGLPQPVPRNGTTFIGGLHEGSHAVTVGDVAPNCTAAAPVPASVVVEFDSIADVSINVACRLNSGTIEVTVATTGTNLDPDGYVLRVDGVSRLAIGPNGVWWLSGVRADSVHSVALGGLASNCDVTPPVHGPLAFSAGDTVQVAFAVVCWSPGAVAVTATTTGAELDPDGYSITLERPGDTTTASVAPNGTVVVDGLVPGAHTLRIGGLANNCAITSPAPDTVTVLSADTVAAAFTVACTPTRGTVRVITTTTGSAPDSNGYVTRVDEFCDPDSVCTWLDEAAIGTNDTVMFDSVPVGGHTLTLSDVALNCAPAGTFAFVTVVGGDTATAAFAVHCDPAGGLEAIITTTGPLLDPDGYGVFVSGPGIVNGFPVAVQDTLVLAGLAGGDYALTMYGVDPNCAVTPPNPRTVAVTSGLTTQVTFQVTCVPPGTIEAIITTTGPSLDLNGYAVHVSGPGILGGFPVAVQDTLVLAGVAAGDYSLTVYDVDPSCAVTPPNPRSVTVTSGVTSQVTFQVTCIPPGALALSVITTGPDPDPNGYFAQVSRSGFATVVQLPANGSVLMPGLVAADYSVRLDGTSANCATTPPNPRTVTVLSGDTAATGFVVTCVAAARLAYTSPQAGNEDVYTVLSNGTGVGRLTTDSASDAEPAWSPDGTRVAFSSRRDGNAEIYVMNADGSAQTRLTNAPGDDFAPAWSPDGTKLAFVSTRNGNREIYVMNADGSNPVRLTNVTSRDDYPAWSPDGSKIAFATERDGDFDIYVMNADGSSQVPLTTNTIPDIQPDWSPDGTRIAFTRFAGCSYYFCDYDIWVMNADGSGAMALITGALDMEPAWSPDGALIALTRRFCDDYYGCSAPSLILHRADGSEWNLLFNASQPAWKR